MAYSPQNIYARHLVSGRGYPLWTPEPNMNLPDCYIREGLKIGDVGVVVPEDGSFDVLFNVCLPPTHSLHRETGVPNNFTPIVLSGRDIAVFPEVESAGRIISTSSVARVRGKDASDEDPERRTQPGPLNYEFTLSSRDGAILILPEGAERYYLRNERLFLGEAIQHAVDWYTFAEQRLGRIINHDSLYLITGFYKARSWSLAAYQQGAGAGESSAQFKAVQVGRGNIAASYTWETSHAMDWRVGPSDQYYNGIANQTVFIQGFKIAVREGILGTKRVHVKADFPAVRPYRVNYSSGSTLSNLWRGGSGIISSSTANISKGTGAIFNIDSGESDPLVEDITIERFPQVAKLFHPSDIINQHLLREVPSATVAVTHDSQWIKLLEGGTLDHGELLQEDRLVAAVARNYSIVAEPEDVVYLQSTSSKNDNNDVAITTSTLSEEYSDIKISSTPPDSPDLQPDFLATDDPSVRLYACGYGSTLSTYLESSHAMYRTAHELQEHVSLAHPDISGTHPPVFRCGLVGCGQSWKRIEELEYHVLSGTHSRNAVSVGSTGAFSESSKSRQVPPTIARAKFSDFGISTLDEPTELGHPTSLYATPTSSIYPSLLASRHHTLLSQQQHQQYIPIPSQAYITYPFAGSTASSARWRPTVVPYYHMSPGNLEHAVHASSLSLTHATGSTDSRSGIAHSSSSHSHHTHTHTGTTLVAAGERYPCDLCDRSFTRLHDRRRHYETVHATSLVVHKCRFCGKEFARADSLKRHVDNGCDEMPR